MVCIYCQAKTQIVNSRHASRNNTTWRRRKCNICQAVFTTSEAPDYEGLWALSSGSSKPFKPFIRDNLYLSIYDSCKHRKNAVTEAAGLTDTVINKLAKTVKDGVVKMEDLKKFSYMTIDSFDKAAGVHYMAFNEPF